MSWQQNEEIPCGQVNQILPQVSTRSKHRVEKGPVCMWRIVAPWGNDYSSLLSCSLSRTHARFSEAETTHCQTKRDAERALSSGHFIPSSNPSAPSAGLTVTSVWNRIGAAPVERGGPVQTGLIQFSLSLFFFYPLLMSSSTRSQTLSTLDNRPSYVLHKRTTYSLLMMFGPIGVNALIWVVINPDVSINFNFIERKHFEIVFLCFLIWF